MRNLFETRNFFKELIKGTLFEPFIKSISDLVKPVNRQDDIWTTHIMQQVITKRSNCIDVGCNTGDFLQPIVNLAPSGKHYAFEPISRLATRLRKRFPSVDVKEVALSDFKGETTFWYVVNSPATSSLTKQVCEQRSSNAIIEPITVETQKLDELLPPDFKVDFLKVDVEGAELKVFKGATRTLKNHKPYVVFEHGKSDAKEFHDNRWHDLRVYDLLVNECGMKVYELKSWLEGLAPLNRDQFAKSPAWNFLATPSVTIR